MSKQLDSTRLQHMLEAAERISRRMAGLSLTDFLADEDAHDVAMRRFMVIGEAANHISNATKQLFPQIDWLGARSLRNFVAHEYFRVELADIWDSVINDVPPLLLELPGVISQVQASEQAQRAGSV
ncbi:DUF86 domain-containing protein [Hymenobacter sp. ASUV-10]|uniref:DUF86 domain-containing protein n=1 Tax=Hymenobacter aranciens TaxID=3063996 RepID=A0ABT9BEW0_9BACT|nr:HepT-like ribonuclease domain-containing protein [Hymenobacter sp. ASUV-10]MDO7876813.1 DUF86 domain-containing protein [Hymenobacter sp. ASUV-10]